MKIHNLIERLLFIIKVVKVFNNWPVYFLICLGLFQGRTIEFHLKGTKKKLRITVPIDSLSRVPLQEVWVFHSYTFTGFDVNEEDVVVDVGANVGNFTIYAADKAPCGTVYAYEPCRENFELLNRNIRLNNLNNVKSFNLGVSGMAGERDIYISGNSVSPSLFKDFKGGNCSYLVEVLSLKDIFDNNNIYRVNFLKIDAEGSEYEILLNAPPAYLNRVDKIAAEYHQGVFTKYRVEHLEELFRGNGFKVSLKPQGMGQTGMIYAWKEKI